MLSHSFAGPITMVPVQTRLSIPRVGMTEQRARTAFIRALEVESESALHEVRAATLAFAAKSRADGLPPEAALIALKRAIGREEWWPSLIAPRMGEPSLQPPEFRLYTRLFPWFFEGFFGSGPS